MYTVDARRSFFFGAKNQTRTKGANRLLCTVVNVLKPLPPPLVIDIAWLAVPDFLASHCGASKGLQVACESGYH